MSHHLITKLTNFKFLKSFQNRFGSLGITPTTICKQFEKNIGFFETHKSNSTLILDMSAPRWLISIFLKICCVFLKALGRGMKVIHKSAEKRNRNLTKINFHKFHSYPFFIFWKVFKATFIGLEIYVTIWSQLCVLRML